MQNQYATYDIAIFVSSASGVGMNGGRKVRNVRARRARKRVEVNIKESVGGWKKAKQLHNDEVSKTDKCRKEERAGNTRKSVHRTGGRCK